MRRRFFLTHAGGAAAGAAAVATGATVAEAGKTTHGLLKLAPGERAFTSTAPSHRVQVTPYHAVQFADGFYRTKDLAEIAGLLVMTRRPDSGIRELVAPVTTHEIEEEDE